MSKSHAKPTVCQHPGCFRKLTIGETKPNPRGMCSYHTQPRFLKKVTP